MVKKKGPTWQFFKQKGKSGVVCKYCNLEYKHSNVNKMTKHIRRCFKCPEEMKKNLDLLPANVSTKLDLSMTMSTPKRKTRCPQQTQLLKNLEVDVSFEPEEVNPGPSSSCRQTFPDRPSPSPSIVNKSKGGLLTFLDHMDNQLNESLNQSLAKAIFVSGAPLSMVEHPLWLEFFKQLRPSFTPPSRYCISSTYLKVQYTEMQNEVTSQLKDSKHLHLQCDGWSNIRNESIVNFVVSKPEPLFVESVATKENRHNASYLAELIINIIEKYGPEKFLVIIGDNASNMRAALALVQKKYPSIIPLGCLAHLLHLLCEDILKCNTVKSFMATVSNIVKTIKNSHVLKALFDRFQLEKKSKDRISLKLPGQTRWGSNLFCLQSLLSNKSVLQKLAVSEETEISSEMKRQILDDGVFWVRAEKMVNILKPIVELITAFESNTPLIHKVHSKFHNLQETLTKEMPESPLQKVEEKNVLKKLEQRIQYGVGRIHLAAELLNPSSQGCNLKPEQLLDAISLICEIGSSMGMNIVDIRQNIADYRDKEGLWRRSFIWEGLKDSDNEKTISPMLWWRGLRGTCVLADVAVRILGAPVTSAATERTFKTFSWIHSKRRNRLTTERAGQIAFISHNWNLLNNMKKPKTQEKSQEKISQEKSQECDMIESQSAEHVMQISSNTNSDSSDCSGSDDEDAEDGHMSLSSHSSDEYKSELEYSDSD